MTQPPTPPATDEEQDWLSDIIDGLIDQMPTPPEGYTYTGRAQVYQDTDGLWYAVVGAMPVLVDDEPAPFTLTGEAALAPDPFWDNLILRR